MKRLLADIKAESKEEHGDLDEVRRCLASRRKAGEALPKLNEMLSTVERMYLAHVFYGEGKRRLMHHHAAWEA